MIAKTLFCVLSLTLSAGATDNPRLPGFDRAGSDAEAIAIADEVVERLGGRSAWDETRYITWRFFGGRLHVWDKWTGDLRYESGELLVLMNVNTREGRAWQSGIQIADADTLAARLQHGYEAWINDSYWLVMPYKLKDSGVTLTYKGIGATEAGDAAEILTLTFKGVGVTPQNKYDVYVTEGERLVRQWAFYANAADESPRFVGPWDDWQQHGRIWLSDGRGQRGHTEVAVFEELPRSVFESPEPVDLMALPGAR